MNKLFLLLLLAAFAFSPSVLMAQTTEDLTSGAPTQSDAAVSNDTVQKSEPQPVAAHKPKKAHKQHKAKKLKGKRKHYAK